jgi:3-hydroxyacyl-CoA dehydrogenase
MALSGAKVAISERNGIRLIILANPSTNALAHDLRVAMMSALDDAKADMKVRGVVLTGSGGFVSGADIRELEAPLSPRVFDLTAAIEAFGKPVIAAIDGLALGGGFEIALACHGRVAAPTSRFGFPEVKLGLLPGAGGTQYAPRVAGLEYALDLVASGRMIDAWEALEAGLIDQISIASPIEAAHLMATSLAQADQTLPRIRDRQTPKDDGKFEAAVAAVTAKAPQSRTIQAIIDAMRAAQELPIDDGLHLERSLFEALRTSPQSKALRYQFFATREAARVPGIHAADAQPVRRIGIIGGGTMGRGIGLAALAGGYHVDLVEPDGDVAAACAAAMRESLQRDNARGRLTNDQLEARLAALIVSTGEAASLPAVDLVIEAAIEDMEVKKRIFSALDQSQPPETVLATNTSSLDIDQIAAATQRPGQVLGLHFFSPANVMRLLEIVRGARTRPEVIATALAVAKGLGKVPVVVGNCDGFVGNRMLAQRHIAAERLLLDGVLPHEVDAVWREFGFPMGVFAMTDLAGVDVNWRVRKARGVGLAIHDAVYALGRYGQKTGLGFYRYEGGSRLPQNDPEVTALIEAESARMGITRRSIPPSEILERLLYPMINEGARILDEGIAQRPGDIDVVWTNGYGWPAWRGGPMHHAETVGLASVVASLERLAIALGDETLRPAPSLQRAVAAGHGIAATLSR